METTRERATRIGTILAQARVEKGMSQEAVALELGKSKKTIINWEKGISKPSVEDALDLFNVLGVSPFPYYLRIFYPNLYESKDDEKVDEQLKGILDALSTDLKKQLIHILSGQHGSSPAAYIQMMVANLHTPLNYRVNCSRLVLDNYEMAIAKDELICKDDIMPDVQLLERAVIEGKKAYIEGKFGYTTRDSEE